MLRETIQNKLNEINNLDCGPFIPDSILENGITYFEYQLQNDFKDSDLEFNYTMQPYILGYVVRKENAEENTLLIVDEFTNLIIKKMKGLNFRCSYKDVSIENGIRKIQITGYVKYNELNNKFF